MSNVSFPSSASAGGSDGSGEWIGPLDVSRIATIEDFSGISAQFAFQNTALRILRIEPGLPEGYEIEVSRLGDFNVDIVADDPAETVTGMATATLNIIGTARIKKVGTDWRLIKKAEASSFPGAGIVAEVDGAGIATGNFAEIKVDPTGTILVNPSVASGQAGFNVP